MARYRVADNTQVALAGTVYGPGEVFEAEPADVAAALAACWAAPAVEDTAPAPRKVKPRAS